MKRTLPVLRNCLPYSLYATSRPSISTTDNRQCEGTSNKKFKNLSPGSSSSQASARFAATYSTAALARDTISATTFSLPAPYDSLRPASSFYFPRSWYSAEDKARFQHEMLQQALQLRTSLGHGSAYLHDFSEDDLINCTGIEPFVLFSRSMLRQLHEMKLAHIDNVLAAQRYLHTSDLSLLSRRSSDDAQQRAYVIATL
eukprot:scaffold24992_cov75-Skeletonema_dohrnii-CCMP3373.AAC.1